MKLAGVWSLPARGKMAYLASFGTIEQALNVAVNVRQAFGRPVWIEDFRTPATTRGIAAMARADELLRQHRAVGQ